MRVLSSTEAGRGDVESPPPSAFELPGSLAAKATPELIARDERHFAAIAESLEQLLTELSDRLDAARRAPAGIGRTGTRRFVG